MGVSSLKHNQTIFGFPKHYYFSIHLKMCCSRKPILPNQKITLMSVPTFLQHIEKATFEYKYNKISTKIKHSTQINATLKAAVHQDQNLTSQKQFLPLCSGPHQQGPGPPLTLILTPPISWTSIYPLFQFVFIVNKNFLYLSLHQKHQRNVHVYENRFTTQY